MPTASLTTTSYAILGWLDVSPWTTYELAKQMQANLNFFWPRAASRLYEEPKNLVAHGLATLERTYVGKRPRTVYQITEKGREELRRWQQKKSAPPTLDFEALVHVYFGGSASPQELLDAIEAVRAYTDAVFAQGTGVAEQYLNETHAFPERIQFSGFIFDFLWSFAELLRDWAERSSAEVATWRDTASSDAKRERAIAVILDCIERRREHEAQRSGA